MKGHVYYRQQSHKGGIAQAHCRLYNHICLCALDTRHGDTELTECSKGVKPCFLWFIHPSLLELECLLCVVLYLKYATFILILKGLIVKSLSWVFD